MLNEAAWGCTSWKFQNQLYSYPFETYNTIVYIASSKKAMWRRQQEKEDGYLREWPCLSNVYSHLFYKVETIFWQDEILTWFTYCANTLPQKNGYDNRTLAQGYKLGWPWWFITTAVCNWKFTPFKETTIKQAILRMNIRVFKM